VHRVRRCTRRIDVHEGASVKTGARRSRDFPDVHSAPSAVAERDEGVRFLQRITVCDTVARLIVARFGRTPPKHFRTKSLRRCPCADSFLLQVGRPTSRLQEDGPLAESRGSPISRYGEETTEPIRGSVDGPILCTTYPGTPRIPGISPVLADAQLFITRTCSLPVVCTRQHMLPRTYHILNVKAKQWAVAGCRGSREKYRNQRRARRGIGLSGAGRTVDPRPGGGEGHP
jgi:hypothetical protein